MMALDRRGFLTATLVPLFVRSMARAAEASRVVPLGDLPLLFADDSGVAASLGVTRTLHPAKRRAAPVLQADRPWETDRVYLYGSVIADSRSGEFRMWYGARQPEVAGRKGSSPGLRGGGFDLTCYATSRDGLTWTKPSLQIHPFRNSKNNNIVFDLHSPSVLFDLFDGDPDRRYKMMGAYDDAYYAATSADGLRWTGLDRPALQQEDTITLTQDPVTGEYLAYHKRMTKVRGHRRRVVWLSRSQDFATWSEPILVFQPDDEDDAWCEQPFQRTEVYNMAVYPHAAGYVGMPAMFRVTGVRERKTLQPGQSPVDGPIDVQLVTSVDGTTWKRTTPRTPVIGLGPQGSFDGGAILGVASTAVHTTDETWVYYTALTSTHGAPMPPKRITIGRAEWRRHGFVSLDAPRDSVARIETVSLRLAGGGLLVNADASAGEVRVALLEADGRPIGGRSVGECQPLRDDSRQWNVAWAGEAGCPTDRPVRVVLEMKGARLFSLSSAPTASLKGS